MLLILITTWLAVVFFGLIMCRLAARSDDSHAVEVADWIAMQRFARREAPSADRAAEQFSLDAEREHNRAAG